MYLYRDVRAYETYSFFVASCLIVVAVRNLSRQPPATDKHSPPRCCEKRCSESVSLYLCFHCLNTTLNKTYIPSAPVCQDMSVLSARLSQRNGGEGRGGGEEGLMMF